MFIRCAVLLLTVLVLAACQTTTRPTASDLPPPEPADTGFSHTWTGLTTTTQVGFMPASINKSIDLRGRVEWPPSLKVLGIAAQADLSEALDLKGEPLVDDTIWDMWKQMQAPTSEPGPIASHEMPVAWRRNHDIQISLRELTDLPDGIGLLTGSNTLLAATGITTVQRGYAELKAGQVKIHDSLEISVEEVRRHDARVPPGEEPVDHPVNVELRFHFLETDRIVDNYRHNRVPVPFVTDMNVLDDEGNSLRVQNLNRQGGYYGSGATFSVGGTWTLMPGRELDAVQFEMVTDTERIIVPFEIRNLRLP